MRHRASRTADASASQRAFHALHGADPQIFSDSYALALCGAWRWFVGPRPMAWLTDRVLFRWARPLVGLHLARARYVEELVQRRAREDGECQYVLVGGGMDSFALRKEADLPDVWVFELDHPATQEMKRHRMARHGFRIPPAVEFCPIDFEQETLSDALSQTRFDPQRRTVFSWMGVVPYLTEEAIGLTVSSIGSLASGGSDLVFDGLCRSLFTDGARTRTGRKLLRFAAARGEPLISAFDPGEWGTLLGDSFEVVHTLDAEAMRRRWFEGRSDGIEPWTYAYLVHARRGAL